MSRADSEAPAEGSTGAQASGDENSGSIDGDAASEVQSEVGVPRIGLLKSLDELEPVRSYLARVNAEAVNFRRAVVRQMVNGYPRTLATISFSSAGAVTVHGEADEPTNEEQAAIEKAFVRVELPKMLALDGISELPPGISLSDPNTFVCHDFDGRVVMIHQRYDTKDGGKGFIP